MLLFVLLGFVLVLFYSSFSWGFVASKFYLWFIVSSFPQVPDITIAQFVGISLFLSAILPQKITQIKSEYMDGTYTWTAIVLAPWITLVCGYIIYSYI